MKPCNSKVTLVVLRKYPKHGVRVDSRTTEKETMNTNNLKCQKSMYSRHTSICKHQAVLCNSECGQRLYNKISLYFSL